ncbi:hypothetical protein EDC04DRAFT_2887050 [Pisolithus marmoratus]|nr:hypothetical protein EDC04DRAFT_2887050 [Pisolithus marmoratus]
MAGTQEPAHHPEFYLSYGTYIFQVEQTLYKLYHPILVDKSDFFVHIFDISSHGPAMEGKDDDNLICLVDMREDVFNMFVQFKFGCPCACEEYMNKDLKNFLEFAQKYQCSKFTCDYIISHIKQRQYCFHPSELVHLGINYKIHDLFKLGFDQLVQTPWTDIKNSHHDFMGSDIFTTLVYVKALLDEHCCIVAAEPPVMRHASNCSNKQVLRAGYLTC